MTDASANWHGLKRNSPIFICETPNSLLAIGANPLPVVINPNDIDKCLAERTANKNKNSHSLSIRELSALPELLAVNKAKALDFFRSTGLQLPEGKEILSFDCTLTHPAASVKSFE